MTYVLPISKIEGSNLQYVVKSFKDRYSLRFSHNSRRRTSTPMRRATRKRAALIYLDGDFHFLLRDDGMLLGLEERHCPHWDEELGFLYFFVVRAQDRLMHFDESWMVFKCPDNDFCPENDSWMTPWMISEWPPKWSLWWPADDLCTPR